MMSKALFEFHHEPVLLAECLEGLALRPDGIYVDCTAGGGGHSSAILRKLGPEGQLISLDRDTEALRAAGQALQQASDEAGGRRYRLVHSEFGGLRKVLDDLGIEKVDGILADLGVSSHQLDEAERGFAYMQDGPLDMRMNPEAGKTAADLVNALPEPQLKEILSRYGEERYAGRIASRIAERRAEKPFSRTLELSDVIRAAMPAKARHEDQHPAKRSFQALRIAVNDELGELESMLEQAVESLGDRGRLAVISFHSLEDRIVKDACRLWEDPCICPRDLPKCVCGRTPLGHAVGRKGVTAGPEEAERNPRARSARLRIFERNSEPYRDYRDRK